MDLTQHEFDDIVADGKKILASEATAIATELESEPDFDLDLGENFGQGMVISISNAAQKIRDMDVSQRATFGSEVSTLVISENPGGDPGV